MSAIKVIDYDTLDFRLFRYFGAGDDLELWDVNDPEFKVFKNIALYGGDSVDEFHPLPSKGIAVIGVGMHPTIYGTVDDIKKDIAEWIDKLFDTNEREK